MKKNFLALSVSALFLTTAAFAQTQPMVGNSKHPILFPVNPPQAESASAHQQQSQQQQGQQPVTKPAPAPEEAGVSSYSGESLLTTSADDDEVTLSVTGAPAEQLFNTIKPTAQYQAGNENVRSSPAVDCYQEKAAAGGYTYKCNYMFRNDGTLIQ
jgi:hypothetical protein